MVDEKNVVAVAGANENTEKYGHIVYRDLKQAGYKVYPVNPNTEKVLGDKCYPNLRSLPQKPDVVNLVVPPKVTEQIVQECSQLGITMVWMQPGSESEKAVEFCHKNGIHVIHGECIMVQRRRLKQQT
ncbi:MAG: CoA-binding protein [Candidatus Bathyarchaeia archaeon]